MNITRADDIVNENFIANAAMHEAWTRCSSNQQSEPN